MMLKALPLAHFSSALLLKQQMIISVKNIKNVRQISSKSIDFQRNRPFFTDCFSAKLAPKISANLPLKILLYFTSAIYQKPCSIAQSIRFDCLKISWTEVGTILGINWIRLCDLAHFFYDESKARKDEMFVLTFNLNLNHREIQSPKWRLNKNFQSPRRKCQSHWRPYQLQFRALLLLSLG